MSSRFASATDCVPEPCRVLGTQLRPFSLGHHLLMAKLGLEPYSQNFSDDDFLALVFLCAHGYEENLQGLLDGEWNEKLKTWCRRIKKVAKDEQARQVFYEYLAAGYRKPPVWTPASAGGIEFSAPWECLLKNRLVAAGHGEQAVLNNFLPAVWYDYYTVLEMNQAANLTDAKHWRKVFLTRRDVEKMEATP